MLARILLLAAASALTIGTTPVFAQAVTGVDAWKAVVGNTIVGKTASGEALVEYFAPDGVAKNRIDGKAGEGEWTLRGDKVCTDYSSDDDDEEADCYALSVKGDVLTLTDDAGKARDFRIAPGNAEKL